MPTPDASARSRGKFDLQQSGMAVVAGIDYGDKAEATLTFTNPFRDPTILFERVEGIRFLVTGVDFVDFADPTKGVSKAYVEIYRYTSGEDPYYSTSGDVTINWVAVGGSAMNPE